MEKSPMEKRVYDELLYKCKENITQTKEYYRFLENDLYELMLEYHGLIGTAHDDMGNIIMEEFKDLNIDEKNADSELKLVRESPTFSETSTIQEGKVISTYMGTKEYTSDELGRCNELLSKLKNKYHRVQIRKQHFMDAISDFDRTPSEIDLVGREIDRKILNFAHSFGKLKDTPMSSNIFNSSISKIKLDAIKKLTVKTYVIFAHARSTLYTEDKDTFIVPDNVNVITSSTVGVDLITKKIQITTDLLDMLRINNTLFEENDLTNIPKQITSEFEKTLIGISFRNHLPEEEVNNMLFNFTERTDIKHIYEGPQFTDITDEFNYNTYIQSGQIIQDIIKRNPDRTRISIILIGCRGDQRNEGMMSNIHHLLMCIRKVFNNNREELNVILDLKIPLKEKIKTLSLFIDDNIQENYYSTFNGSDEHSSSEYHSCFKSSHPLYKLLIRLLATFPNIETMETLTNMELLELINLTPVKKGSPRFSARERSPRSGLEIVIPDKNKLISDIIEHITKITSVTEGCNKLYVSSKIPSGNKYFVEILQSFFGLQLSNSLTYYIADLLFNYFKKEAPRFTRGGVSPCESFDVTNLNDFLQRNITTEIIAEYFKPDSMFEAENDFVSEQKIKKIIDDVKHKRVSVSMQRPEDSEIFLEKYKLKAHQPSSSEYYDNLEDCQLELNSVLGIGYELSYRFSDFIYNKYKRGKLTEEAYNDLIRKEFDKMHDYGLNLMPELYFDITPIYGPDGTMIDNTRVEKTNLSEIEHCNYTLLKILYSQYYMEEYLDDNREIYTHIPLPDDELPYIHKIEPELKEDVDKRKKMIMKKLYAYYELKNPDEKSSDHGNAEFKSSQDTYEMMKKYSEQEHGRFGGKIKNINKTKNKRSRKINKGFKNKRSRKINKRSRKINKKN
jgi:hypothetical protein